MSFSLMESDRGGAGERGSKTLKKRSPNQALSLLMFDLAITKLTKYITESLVESGCGASCQPQNARMHTEVNNGKALRRSSFSGVQLAFEHPFSNAPDCFSRSAHPPRRGAACSRDLNGGFQ